MRDDCAKPVGDALPEAGKGRERYVEADLEIEASHGYALENHGLECFAVDDVAFDAPVEPDAEALAQAEDVAGEALLDERETLDEAGGGLVLGVVLLIEGEVVLDGVAERLAGELELSLGAVDALELEERGASADVDGAVGRDDEVRELRVVRDDEDGCLTCEALVLDEGVGVSELVGEVVVEEGVGEVSPGQPLGLEEDAPEEADLLELDGEVEPDEGGGDLRLWAAPGLGVGLAVW